METKIISISYNSDKLAAQAADLAKKIEETKEQLKQLDKTSPDFAKASAELNVYKKEYSNINKQIEANIVLNKQDGKSVYELQQANIALTKQYDNLTEAERNSEEVGGQLQASIKAITDQLKGLEGQTGRTGRNVGNYEESIVSAANTIDGMKAKLKDLEAQMAKTDVNSDAFGIMRKEADGLTLGIMQATGKVDEFGEKMAKNPAKEELNTLGDVALGLTSSLELLNLEGDKNSDTAKLQANATKALAAASLLRNIQIGIGSVMDAKDVLVKKASTAAEYARTIAVNGATAAQRVFNLVLTMNPIGLVVAAIGLAVVAFTELTQKSKIFSTIFQALTLQFQIAWKLLQPLLESMGLVDSEAEKQAAKRQEETQKQADNLDKVGKKYKDQADLLKALGGDETKIRELQRKQLIEQLAVVEKVAKYTKDKNAETIASDKEKYEDQLQAIALFDAESTKLKAENEAKEQKRIEDNKKKARDLANKELQVAADLLNAKADLMDKGSKKELSTRVLAIQKMKTAELNNAELTAQQRELISLKYKKQADELVSTYNQKIAQDKINLDLSVIDKKLAAEKQGSTAYFELQKDRLLKEKELKLISAKNDVTAKTLIEAEYNLKLLEMTKARVIAEGKISEEIQIAAINTRLNEVEKNSAEELRLQKEKIDLQLKLDTDRINAEIANEELKNAKIAELNSKAIIDTKAAEDANVKANADANKAKQDNDKKTQDDKIALVQQTSDTVAGIATQLNTLLATIDTVSKNKELKDAGNNSKKKEEIEKKYAEKAKQRQITQLTIDTIVGAANAFMSGLKIDPTGVLGGILAALVVAQGAASIAAVESQKFAYGGLVQGSGNGDTVPAMLSPGEMVMRKDAVSQYGGTLSAINESVGGQGIAGLSASRITAQPNNNDIVSAIKQMKQPIVTVRDLQFGLQDNSVTQARTTI
jgi:hypothetical protein